MNAYHTIISLIFICSHQLTAQNTTQTSTPHSTLVKAGAKEDHRLKVVPKLKLSPQTIAEKGQNIVTVSKQKVIKDSESETIEKCLIDLSSDSVETRKKAVMILGKYDRPVAFLNIIAALGDKHEKVRTSALVSLFEKRQLPTVALVPLLDLLGDENIHIRRLVSSSLNKLAMLMYQYNADELQKKTKRVFIEAFSDSDSSVRYNMVKYYNSQFAEFAPNLLDGPLGDAQVKIRIAALQCIVSTGEYELLYKHMDKLVIDDDPTIRLNLAQGLSRAGANPKVFGVLRILLRDTQVNIAANAAVSLMNAQKQVDSELIEHLLNNPEIDTRVGVSLITELAGNKDGEPNLILALLKHSKSEFRTAAFQVSRRVRGLQIPTKILLSAFDDESMKVRREVGMLIYTDRRISIDDIADFSLSEYSDVRRDLVRCTSRFSSGDAELLLSDLLLDEDEQVRIAVLGEYSRRRIVGYQDILMLSLEDPNEKIQIAAVSLLMRSKNPHILKIVADFGRSTTNTRLKNTIQQFILRQQKRSKK